MIKQPDNFNEIEFYKSLFSTAVDGKAVMGYLKPAGVGRNLYDILFGHGTKIVTKFMQKPMVYDCRYKDSKKCINFGKRPFNLSKHTEFKDFYKNVFEKLAYASVFYDNTSVWHDKYPLSTEIKRIYERVCVFGDLKFEEYIFYSFSDFPELQALYFHACDSDFVHPWDGSSNWSHKSEESVRNAILNNKFATFEDKVWCKSPSLDKLRRNIIECKSIIGDIKNDVNIEKPDDIFDKGVAKRVNDLVNDLNKEIEPLKFKSSADDIKNAWINWCKSARSSKAK